jgi:hypothetical protein
MRVYKSKIATYNLFSLLSADIPEDGVLKVKFFKNQTADRCRCLRGCSGGEWW